MINELKRDKQDLPKVQMALVVHPPVPPTTSVSRILQDRIPVLEEESSQLKEERKQLAKKEVEVSSKLMEELKVMDGSLETLEEKQRLLKQQLEEVEKQIAETEANRKDVVKSGENDLNSIALRKRITDNEANERDKTVQLVDVAMKAWSSFCENKLIEYVNQMEQTHQNARTWLEERLERMYECLEMYYTDLEKATSDCAASGGKGLLAIEALKVAKQDANAYVNEANQFLASFPPALHEQNASSLNDIIGLRDKIQVVLRDRQFEGIVIVIVFFFFFILLFFFFWFVVFLVPFSHFDFSSRVEKRWQCES